MFGCGYRTPPRATHDMEEEDERAMPPVPQSIGEASSVQVQEATTPASDLNSQRSPSKDPQAGPSKHSSKAVLSQGEIAVARKEKVQSEAAIVTPELKNSKLSERVAEAKSCLISAKLQMNNSRNTKTEIKNSVIQSLERLYQLVKDSEAAKSPNPPTKPTRQEAKDKHYTTKGKEEVDLLKKIEEHGLMIKQNNEAMERLKEALEKQKDIIEKTTYANVVANNTRKRTQERAALHSVVISSKDETETGEQVLAQIREAVNAREGWVKVDRVRKAKDRRVIVGCSSVEERDKVKERLKKADQLKVEDIQNKDPLLVLKDVLAYNSDDDLKSALKNQNRGIFEGIGKVEDRIEIRFRRKTRNPHVNHVVIRVSPKLWTRMVEAETVHVDLQRVRVADYSPLVQCSICLGYGHGRRFCTETVPKCCHCGGSHMKAECADWHANVAPSCCNCVRAKLEQTEHNAFSQECPVRRKWDAIARESIAYC
ncbi:jg8978 [Pararge aegeria aegeria]|uniref:Jg8978 protein n=1 Tax=Pararge aegeria aegeria TaxID=348720 RepID=A0A8S4QYB3_9NEOP|nr:jg8978 [Pararge aegeria aegeria]